MVRVPILLGSFTQGEPCDNHCVVFSLWTVFSLMRMNFAAWKAQDLMYMFDCRVYYRSCTGRCRFTRRESKNNGWSVSGRVAPQNVITHSSCGTPPTPPQSSHVAPQPPARTSSPRSPLCMHHIKTHRADVWVSVRVSSVTEIRNSDRNVKLSLMKSALKKCTATQANQRPTQ